MVLAASYFGFFTLLLTVIPISATRLGGNSTAAGVALALFGGIGIIADGQVGRVVARWGMRRVLLGGVVAALLGVVGLFFATDLITLAVTSAVMGIATSFLVNPILSGMATHAGEKQIRAQAENAIAQRCGAMVAAAFVSGALMDGQDDLMIASVLIGLLIVLGVTSSLLRGAPSASEAPLTATVHSSERTLSYVARSRRLQSGLLVNLTIPLLIIFGSSFFPLILGREQGAALVVACLVGREVVALLAAAVARRFTQRRHLHTFWRAAVICGVAGVVGAMLSDSHVVTVLLFSIHGAGISLGIMTLNVRIYDSTVPDNRMTGFGLASIVGRFANLLFPVLLGYAMGISTATILLVFVLLMALAVGAQWVLDLASSRDTTPRLVDKQ